MLQCKCRAFTRDGEPYYFTVADIPVRVYPDRFTLASRPGTPLLEMESACKVANHLNIGTGDRVVWQGEEFTVAFHKGFFLRSESGLMVPSNLVDSCQILEFRYRHPQPLLFKHKSYIFTIREIFGLIDSKAVIAGKEAVVDPYNIKTHACFLNKKSRLFYGDIVDGQEVVMWKGRTCFYKDNVYVDIATGFLIGGAPTDGSN